MATPLTPTADITVDEIVERSAAIRAELSRRTMMGFTTFTNRDYEVNWHHNVVAEKLDEVLVGKLRRLIILMPPQNGKSELVSRRFPAYALGRFPDKRIIATSYGADLAGDMSRDVQKIIDSPAYRLLFPSTRLAEGSDPEVKTTRQFNVVGRKGYYYSAGVGGALTGKSSDIGIIDDPVKNRAEAESLVFRNSVWNWYVSTFATRQFGDTGAIIICVTRWHEDDLVGRLLQLEKEEPTAEKWTVVRFEAIAENPDRAIDHREKGEPLWPAKYPLRELNSRRITAGLYDWNSLYQQRPTPPGGKLFKREWFADKYVDTAPVHARRVRGWDTAATEDGGDYTVGVRICEANDIFYVENVRRGQWSSATVDAEMKQAAEDDGKKVSIREEKEPGSSGKAVINARVRTLKGYDYAGVTVDKDKATRARPFKAQCEAGNVRIVRGPWNKDYIDELCDFPGVHDDQVDGTSCAFNAVVELPKEEDSAGVW